MPVIRISVPLNHAVSAEGYISYLVAETSQGQLLNGSLLKPYSLRSAVTPVASTVNEQLL